MVSLNIRLGFGHLFLPAITNAGITFFVLFWNGPDLNSPLSIHGVTRKEPMNTESEAGLKQGLPSQAGRILQPLLEQLEDFK
jgi:hypothetical protein